METRKKTYLAPSADAIYLESVDVITLSSPLEPDWEDDQNEENGGNG